MSESKRTEKVDTALQGLLRDFESGNIADTVARAVFPMIADIPSAKWSLLNRILMVKAGTSDARGYRQWREGGRQVKKGCKAIHILGPRMVKKEKVPGETEMHLVGFVSIPVFRAEDTDGEPLAYENLAVPDLPLLDVARRWGINVRAVSFQGEFFGRYRLLDDEIILCTPEEGTFFHELAHAAHHRVLKSRGDSMKGGQDWKQEIVAELSAAVLCRLVGRSHHDTSGNSYRYVAGYAEKAKKDVLKAIATVIGDVERILNLIVGSDEPAAVTA